MFHSICGQQRVVSCFPFVSIWRRDRQPRRSSLEDWCDEIWEYELCAESQVRQFNACRNQRKRKTGMWVKNIHNHAHMYTRTTRVEIKFTCTRVSNFHLVRSSTNKIKNLQSIRHSIVVYISYTVSTLYIVYGDSQGFFRSPQTVKYSLHKYKSLQKFNKYSSFLL